MANRMISYGYGMESGKLVVIDGEAEIVRRVFREYIEGKLLQEIADELTEEGVAFYLENRLWNKNKVFRIIENEKAVIGDTIQQLQALKIKVNGGNGAIGEIDTEMAALSKQNSTYSDLFLKGVIDSVLDFEKTDRLKNRITELRERRQKLVNEDEEEKCLEKLRALKRVVEKKPFLTEMDEALFDEIVDRICVGQDGALTFVLKCELKLRVKR